jgi:hypothetical protein
MVTSRKEKFWMSDEPVVNQDPVTRRRRRHYPIGAPEFYQVWPMALFAILLIGLVYGICVYESLFQLPLLGPVK